MSEKNFEKTLVQRIDQQKDFVAQAYDKVVAKSFEKFRPNPEDFTDIFPKDEARKDMEAVSKKRQEIKQRQTPEDQKDQMAATLLEGIISEEINKWFENFHINPASEYDDLFNGTDAVAEIELDEEILRFAIDATTNIPGENEKLNQIIMNVESGRFQTIKYFESDIDEVKGQIEIPKFIISVSRNKVEKLARLIIEKAEEKLQWDDIQIEIIEQLILQTEFMEPKLEKKRLLKQKEVLFQNKKIPVVYRENDQNFIRLKMLTKI